MTKEKKAIQRQAKEILKKIIMTKYVKVQLFVPKSHINKVRLALGTAGIGKMGNYDHTAFVSEGRGYFRPLAGSNPTIGKLGKIEEVSELKLEFVCLKSEIEKVKEIIKLTHPYEEVALDILTLTDLPSIKTKRKIGFKP